MNLLKLVSNYISNDGPNGYTVNFCCPEVNIGGKVPEFIAAYFLMQAGGSTSHAGAAVQLFNGLLKFVHAGTPVLGKLKIEKGYLGFTPTPGSSLVMKGCKMVRIPLDDISFYPCLFGIHNGRGYLSAVDELINTVLNLMTWVFSPFFIADLCLSLFKRCS